MALHHSENDLPTLAREITSGHRVDTRSLLPSRECGTEECHRQSLQGLEFPSLGPIEVVRAEAPILTILIVTPRPGARPR
ncbi:hypothetical protein XH99_29070 [Bradyrhizobium nanningense]|uniref:Uncharacterized protein n=1 Tax=Bradyrhizobium nanningense TaxID=1325118 RepID=A0A4Q0RWX3_9BRAD|nr:hypothetical protein XH99_29070 [Bradyrhizobium nanningense]RXH29305.1 hypothetical protein XH84_22720 [Bradyrhizobium nanningense]